MAINRRTLGTANNTAIRITLKTFYLNNTAPSAIVTGLNSSAKICGWSLSNFSAVIVCSLS
jgi:hypothetical protein